MLIYQYGAYPMAPGRATEMTKEESKERELIDAVVKRGLLRTEDGAGASQAKHISRVVSITHAADIDGIASAAMLVHYYNLPLENVVFINYDNSRFPHAIAEISKLNAKDTLFIISDFNPSSTLVPEIVKTLEGLKKDGNHVIWLDHHPWAPEAIEAIPKVADSVIGGENAHSCGTQLVYELLCKKDEFGDNLAHIAHTADFALRPDSASTQQTIKVYASAINYFNLGPNDQADARLKEVVSSLARGESKNDLVERACASYVAIEQEGKKVLLESATMVTAGGYSIAVGFSSGIGAGMGCRELMNKFGSDIAIYVNTTPGRLKGDLRSVKGVECNKLAEAMHGGGHPQAAGFNIPEGSYDFSKPADRERFIAEIVSSANKAYPGK